MSQEITKKIFLEILDEAKSRLLKSDLKLIKSGEDFETRLFQVIQDICSERNIADFGKTGKHSFPDIRIGHFGIEAKFTVGDSWVTTGNSITESTKKDDFELIYIFFCKQGKKGKPDIMFRPYEQCLSDIVVTHSPRYKINMELQEKDSIFTKMGVDYASFCKDNPIEKAKNYFKKIIKKGEEFWWIDSGVTPIIRIFSDLDKNTQESFKIEAMVLFPEIFSRSPRKYDGPTLRLFQEYQARCSSFRDLFTAGGKVRIRVATGKTITVPRIFSYLHHYAKEIKKALSVSDRDELSKIWGIKLTPSDDLQKVWLELVGGKSGLSKENVALIYNAGLRDA